MTSLATLTARTPGLPCRDDPDQWFSDQAADRFEAVRLCRGCPVRVECATYALEERVEFGVWGGTTAADRRSVWTGRPWRFDEQGRLRLVCGSEEAYRSHFAYQEQPGPDCVGGDCVGAHAAHVEAQRRERLDEEHAKGGSSVGYFLHRALGESACGSCRAANAAQQRAAKAAPPRRGARRGRRRARSGSGSPGAADAVNGAQAPVQAFPVAS